MNRDVVLSFDYELFFGDLSGSVLKTLIEPTNRILDTLDSVNGKAVFFVDYLMLKRMKSESEKTLLEASIIENQLRDIVRRGSRLELHLHPHWLDAKYKNGEWDFSDFNHYCLNSLSKEIITQLFVEGTDYLNSLAQSVDPSYKVIAFRAGGWAILPFNMIKDGFLKSGIYIDSSVTSKMLISGYTHSVDFRNSPNNAVYSFDDDVLKETGRGCFCEFQISSFYMSFLERAVSSIYRKVFNKRYRVLTDGTHRQSKRDENIQRTSFFSKFHGRWSSYSINESVPFFLLLRLLLRTSKVTVIIGHPKDFNLATTRNIALLSKIAALCTYNELLK